MIDFTFSSQGHIHFDGENLAGQLNNRYQKARQLLEKIAFTPTPIKLPSSDLDLMARHPLAQGLLAYQQGYVRGEVAESLLVELGELDTIALDCLKNDRASLFQCQSLLPEIETRGESIRTVKHFRYNQQEISRATDLITEHLGKDYRRFVGVIRTISIVEVPRIGEAPYFSGSDSNFWGAMHTTDPADDFVFAETLTHEAAHHWMLLVEELQPLAENCWEGNHWISPWRSDARPIGGVIHGVFVFSCAILVLNVLRTSMKASAAYSAERVERRICRLFAQVEQGIAEMARCPQISETGRHIASSSRRRLDSVEPSLDIAALQRERRQCEEELDGKRLKLLL